MLNSVRRYGKRVLETAVAATPWLMSMYFLYWLDHEEIWTRHTAHRGKMSFVVIVLGMSLSFFILSYFMRRRER